MSQLSQGEGPGLPRKKNPGVTEETQGLWETTRHRRRLRGFGAFKHKSQENNQGARRALPGTPGFTSKLPGQWPDAVVAITSPPESVKQRKCSPLRFCGFKLPYYDEERQKTISELTKEITQEKTKNGQRMITVDCSTYRSLKFEQSEVNPS